MSEDVKSFVVYDDIEAVLDELTDEQVGQLFRGMVSYHSSGTDPKFTGVLKYVFIPIKQGIDRNTEKYEKRCERNRENANKRWQDRNHSDAIAYDGIRSDAMDANTNTNTNTNTKTNSKSNTKSTEVDVWSLSRSVLSYLNSAAGTNYRTDDVDSVRLISELSHSGYTEEQMKTVIEKKCGDWLGDGKFEQYLRPSTLFGPKFEQYLNQPDTDGKKKRDEAAKKKKARAEARKQLEEKTEEMDRLSQELDAAEDISRKIDIKGKMAVLEAQMEVLRVRVGP